MSHRYKKLLVIVTGPTAVGKTKIAIDLAKHYQTCIISADSRQIYKELNIGTAKPDVEEMQGIKHYFLDHISIKDNYSAGMFETECLSQLKILFEKNQVVIMAGGTGLFIKAVCEGFDDIPKVSKETRESVIKFYKKNGIKALQKIVQECDPVSYESIDINNPQRLMRIVELFWEVEKPLSSFKKQKKITRDFQILKIGLHLDRDQLYAKINERVDRMMEKGLLEEVKSFYKFKHLNALNTVGYSELFMHLSGVYTLEKAVDLIKQNTRRYAKRQMTWWRKDNSIKEFNVSDKDVKTQLINLINSRLG